MDVSEGAATSLEPERRLDPSDKKFYTEAEFFEYYGSREPWDAAAGRRNKSSAETTRRKSLSPLSEPEQTSDNREFQKQTTKTKKNALKNMHL